MRRPIRYSTLCVGGGHCSGTGVDHAGSGADHAPGSEWQIAIRGSFDLADAMRGKARRRHMLSTHRPGTWWIACEMSVSRTSDAMRLT